MNKNGKSSTLKTVLIVALVAVLLVAVFMVAKNVQFGSKTPLECQESTASVSWASQNALNVALPVTGISYSVKDEKSGSAGNASSYGVGHNLEYLASANGSIAEIKTYEIPCGGGTITTKLTEVTSPAVDIFNSNNLIIDNAATNQSAIADGASATLGMRLTGVNKQSTGDMVLVLETNSSVNTLTVGGAAAGTTAPEFRATQVTPNSKVFTFDIPAITGAISKTYDMVIGMKDTAHYCGVVYYDLYAKQAFEDTDGAFKTGIQDANGVAQYAQVTSGSFVIDCP